MKAAFKTKFFGLKFDLNLLYLLNKSMFKKASSVKNKTILHKVFLIKNSATVSNLNCLLVLWQVII